ncbi:hypothetical protein POX_a01876 [Penicillium oxalicum]|uniref:Uncharacterized protein n=1 Tax=Penicillium oxalicum (strain 114-2 / CGMCC 5302) TaxID=933388 RepID=S8BDN0_PENO1|nr:hypothetical protein POX_a01876 [Penicillium oxalicum]EPS33127.1 hypothetical protein PDE_08089 [Penicillium oxalicum 114-2]KAI2795271.1 hypothetical protein POX_a01876 [Penicillium oxalicum]
MATSHVQNKSCNHCHGEQKATLEETSPRIARAAHIVSHARSSQSLPSLCLTKIRRIAMATKEQGQETGRDYDPERRRNEICCTAASDEIQRLFLFPSPTRAMLPFPWTRGSLLPRRDYQACSKTRTCLHSQSCRLEIQSALKSQPPVTFARI